MIKDLEASGYIVDRSHRRRLVERGRLLDTWAEFYADTLRPKLDLGRFRSSRPDWWRTATPLDYGALWGGETAGALLTGHLRPEVSTVYAPSLPKELMVAQRLSRSAVDVDGRRIVGVDREQRRIAELCVDHAAQVGVDLANVCV